MDKKIIYFYLVFIIALFCFQNVVSEDKVEYQGGLIKKQYDALKELMGRAVQVDSFFGKYNKTEDYDFCSNNNGLVVCENKNVKSLILRSQDSLKDGKTLHTSLFENLKLDTLELASFDLETDFLGEISATSVTLDLCKGFKWKKVFKMTNLKITVDENYWEKGENSLNIDGDIMDSVISFNFLYTGVVNESTTITLTNMDSKHENANWHVALTDIPNLSDETNFNILNIRLLKSPTTDSYGYIADYEGIINLSIVSANKYSEINLDSQRLFTSLIKLVGSPDNSLIFIGIEGVSLSPIDKAIDFNISNSNLQEIKIKNAGYFGYVDNKVLTFPFSGFSKNTNIITFNDWKGNSVDFSSIKNSESLTSITMQSSSLNDKYENLKIPSNVAKIDFTNSHITGSVPDSECSRSILQLSNNRLLGELPSCYICYPQYQSSFSKNPSIKPSSTNVCDYEKIIKSIKVNSKEIDGKVQINVTGENIGFTADDFNKYGNVIWSVLKTNSFFKGEASNSSIRGHTFLKFNGGHDLLLPFDSTLDINVDRITVNNTKDKTLLGFIGDHLSQNSVVKISGKDNSCNITSGSYLQVLVSCQSSSGKVNITVERLDNVPTDGKVLYSKEIDLSMKEIIFCKQNCKNGCNLATGTCKDGNSGGNDGGKDDGGKNDGGKNDGGKNDKSEDNQMKVDKTSNVVLGIIILIFIVGLIYIAYTKFLAPNSTSTQNSSYRNLKARDEEEFEDGIPMKTREDQE